MDISIGPTLTAFIEFDPDGVAAQLVELRLPFVPRVGERLSWGSQDKRTIAEVCEIFWVMGEPDENDIVRVRHVNIRACPLKRWQRGDLIRLPTCFRKRPWRVEQ